MKVTKAEEVNCYDCSGTGWISAYHNDTEDCSVCSGTGKVTAAIKLSQSEMMASIESEFGYPPSASEIFSILEIHKRWSK